jgi:solute carrier family 25 aspartate/glutamate transporter 12/13
VLLNPSARYLDQEAFVDAIAPKDDLSRMSSAQFGILFKVADRANSGRVSWDDFYIFETLLKRPDAEYWIAFQYFDVYVSPGSLFDSTWLDFTWLSSEGTGKISAEEFQNVFSQNLGPDAIPFSFDSDWLTLYLGKKDGTHVLGCKFVLCRRI